MERIPASPQSIQHGVQSDSTGSQKHVWTLLYGGYDLLHVSKTSRILSPYFSGLWVRCSEMTVLPWEVGDKEFCVMVPAWKTAVAFCIEKSLDKISQQSLGQGPSLRTSPPQRLSWSLGLEICSLLPSLWVILFLWVLYSCLPSFNRRVGEHQALLGYLSALLSTCWSYWGQQ